MNTEQTFNAAQNNSLPGVGALLKESWQKLTSRWKVILGLEVVDWIPFILGIVILLAFVFPAAKNAAINTSDAQQQVTFPINFQSGELKVSEQPNVKTSIPLAALPASARMMMGVAWIAFVIGVIMRLAIWNGQIYALGSETLPSLGMAFGHGWKRWFPTLGHIILMTLIFTPLGLLLMLPFLGAALGGILFLFAGAEAAGFLKTVALVGGLLLLVVVPLYVFLYVRLSFVLPLTALGEGKGTFSESWRITKGRFWSIFWRLLAFTLLMMVILIPLQLVLGGVNLLTMGQVQAQAITGVVGGIILMVLQFALALYGISYTVALLRNSQRTQTALGSGGTAPVIIIILVILILLVLAGLGVMIYSKFNSLKGSGLIRPVTTGEEQVVQQSQAPTANIPSPNQELLSERYTHPALGFSIQPPKGWKTEWAPAPEPDSGTLRLCPPEEGSHCMTVNIAPLSFFGEKDTVTIDEHIANNEKQAEAFKQFLPSDSEVQNTKEKYHFGSVEGYILKTTSTTPIEDPLDGSKTSFSQDVLAIKSPLRYNVHDPFTDDERIKYGAAIDAAILSFRVE